jgi:hypothetical protein
VPTLVTKAATAIIAAALTSWAVNDQAAETGAQPTVQPGAVQALARMSAYLRSIPNFLIAVQTQSDDVDVYGQLITLNGRATYSVRRPDAFSIELALPNIDGQYVYDGKTLTVYDAKGGYYAKIPAPSTIRATLELAEQKYGAKVPLDDLFRWSEGDDQAKALTSAHYVGKARIAGQTASQYAFRQSGVDWQIWIADGPKPEPLRMIIVGRNDPARPQFQADFSWNTAPQFTAGAFGFTPPPNVRLANVHPIH